MNEEAAAHLKAVYDTATCLFTKTVVGEAVERMASDLTAQLAEKNPLILCVVVGGIMPMGFLLPHLTFPLQVDYLHVTRYRGKTSGAELHWLAYPSTALKDRHVVIVDDILDGGLTMQGILDYCDQEGARSATSVVLLDKHEARVAGGTEKADIAGLALAGNPYVFGCGMDYRGYFRNIPDIYAVDASFLDK
jgi:hypoxanthine phosphoribosyltransferase